MADPECTSFVDVRARLHRHADSWGRIEIGADGAVSLARRRAHVVVLDGTSMHPPQRYDVLVVVAPAPAMAEALLRLRSQRIALLQLPCAATVVDTTIAEALRAATFYDQSRMAERLLEIAASLNAERDLERLLHGILRHAREITHADAGSIYLVEGAAERLTFKVSQNDSLSADFAEFSIPVTPHSIVGSTVLRQKSVRVDDLYADRDADATLPPWSHDRSFDLRSGYQTRSMISTPMITPAGRVVGVIQLINAKRDRAPLRAAIDFLTRVEPFSDQDEQLCDALAAQGAVALDNARLYAEIQALFEGFVRASVLAIEQRDPTTSGHSQRVADLTVTLARAADRATFGPFAATAFSADQLREIEYAGLLHDFGKVGVREEVLVKAKKLYPHQLERVIERFEHMRSVLRAELAEARLARSAAGLADVDLVTHHRVAVARIDAALAAITRANEPTILTHDVSETLAALSSLEFVDSSGRQVTPLGNDELAALQVARGSLTAEERVEIQHHVTHTYNFLVRIPWGTTLAAVPEIAGKHHEYLNGTGYPAHLQGAAIPLQARMMTVADIFDALTASDRPYKRAVPAEMAVEILRGEVAAGKVDADVFELFVAANLWNSLGGHR